MIQYSILIISANTAIITKRILKLTTGSFMMAEPDDPRNFLLDSSPSESDKEITGCRLPTVRQVLFCFLAHHSPESKLTVREAAKETVKQVLPLYKRGRTPHLHQVKMEEEVVSLHKEMKTLLKIGHPNRSSPGSIKKIGDFKNKLETTMKFWPRNVFQLLKNEDDRNFFESMLSDRAASFGPENPTVLTTELKVAKRKAEEEKRNAKELKRLSDLELQVSLEDSFEDFSDTEDEEYQEVKRSHKRTKKTGTEAFWPHDVMKSPAVVETAVRNKISPTVLASITHSFITATGGDHSKVNLDFSTAYRYKTEASSSIVTQIRDSWTAPAVGLLHWDGKLMETLRNKYRKEERLPVSISGTYHRQSIKHINAKNIK